MLEDQPGDLVSLVQSELDTFDDVGVAVESKRIIVQL